MGKYKERLSMWILFAFSLISVFWMLSTKNSFCFDDTTWMLTVSTKEYSSLFTFFPHSAYLDRPVGVIFMKFLYELFELDYTRHHAVLVLVHLLNVYLTYIVFKEVFSRRVENKEQCHMGALVTAAFFGIWYRTHMAVQWDAAIFDLLGVTLSLASMWFYLRYRNDERYKGQNLFLTLLFYYLAIRTKEMFLVISFLFVLYEIWEMVLEKTPKKLSRAAILGLILFIVFFGAILYCKMQGSITNDPNNPYYQSFNPILLIKNLLRYCLLCFDVKSGAWSYSPTLSGRIGQIVILIGLAAALLLAVFKKKFGLLFSYIAIGISIVIVLPMVNQVHVLYLYFPSIFVGMLIGCIVMQLEPKYGINVALIMMCSFLGAGYCEGGKATQEYWMTMAQMEKKVWDDIQALPAPVKESNIYIRNLDNVQYTPFFYGNGGVCKLLYKDESLNVVMLASDEEIEYVSPYVIWNYKDGHIEETARDEFRMLEIQEVYPQWQEDGSLMLGIVPDKITSMMKIYIDDAEVETVVGEMFISTRLFSEQLEGKNHIEIKVADEYGTVSSGYELEIRK